MLDPLPENINEIGNPLNWGSGELAEIKNRASKLSVEELKELTELVGIYFPESEGLTADAYLDVLDEADSKEVILEYLVQKGV